MRLSGFNNTLDTLERAVKERVFFVKEKGAFVPPPKPHSGHFQTCMEQVRNLLVPLLPRAAVLTRQQFVDTFHGRKRAIYQEAADSLLRVSVSPADARVQVFVKYEKTDYTRKSDPVPRVISPRNPRYNVEVGKFLRPVEERVFDSLAGLFEGKKTVFKGMNASESGRKMFDLWNSFRNPVAVGLDASRFDQHVSLEALEWEHSIYPHCFHESRRNELRSLLAWQVENKCTGYTEDGKLKYCKTGGRMSGDMNTSLGNCILMCSMIKQYSIDRGVRTLLANNGDDCVVFMEAADLEQFSWGLDGWFRVMGFNMTVEAPCYTFEEIEFCQTHPVFVGPDHDSYLMVRHPKWAIAKDTMSVHPLENEKMVRGWMNAVGQGGLAMTGGVPVFQNFYRSYCREGMEYRLRDQVQSWGVRSLQVGMERRFVEPTPETRASFYWAFGVTPDEQLVLERFYDDISVEFNAPGAFEFQPSMPL